jgi:hypothetical protein
VEISVSSLACLLLRQAVEMNEKCLASAKFDRRVLSKQIFSSGVRVPFHTFFLFKKKTEL